MAQREDEVKTQSESLKNGKDQGASISPEPFTEGLDQMFDPNESRREGLLRAISDFTHKNAGRRK